MTTFADQNNEMNMKHILFTLTLLGGMMFTMVTMLSCSKDDDQFLAETSNATDTFSNMADSLAVDFYLQTVEGIRTITFQSGENIVFHLLLRNKSNQQVQLPPAKTLIGNDLFRVYSSNGQDKGTSWFFGPAAEANLRIAPGKQLHYHINRSSLRRLSYTEPLCLKAGNQPLSAGRYFVIAPVCINEEINFFCVINFEVKS